jgi:hypothetical protein
MSARIRVIIPEKIESPLRDMEELIPASLINVVPERREETKRSLAGVSLVIQNDREWVAHYSYTPDDPKIRISIRTVETLWCLAYAYVVLLDEVFAKRAPDDRTPADLNNPPLVKDAMGLLRWALQDWLDAQQEPLPEHLMPKRLPRQLGSSAAVADELCLCAVAFILHHELAHHRLKHGSHGIPKEAADSIDMERDADLEAVDWILSGVDPDSRFFTKRAAGIAVALVGMTGRGVHSGKQDSKTHPRNFDRLLGALKRYDLDPNAPAWIFSTIALKLHLDNSDLKLPAHEFESYKDCLESYVELLASEEH